MALVLANRVRETTTTTGTGTVTLAGAVTGYQSFSAIGNANTTYYTISGQGTSQWEVGIGTYTASGTTLSRDTVLASSNSGSLVSFSAGTKDVFVTYPSNKSVYLDASGNASSLGTPAAFTATNVTGLPVSTGLSGLGTGVATALGVNTGSAGAFVVNGGALGTPSSGTVTNLTGTANININGTVGATTPTTGAFTTGTHSSGVSVGGATAQTSGVAFPATAVAVSDANTLDDYEEGTWTPSLGGNTTYLTQSGTYTKIGRQITVHFDLAISTLGTGSMTTITGLPFTVSGTVGGSIGTFSTLAVNVLGFWCYATSTLVTFQSLTVAGVSATNQPAIFGNSASIRGTVTYFV